MKAVIMAGGRGKRIASICDSVPKPMIPICGKPVLEYQIENLKKQGVQEFILVVGYKGQTIINYFGTGTMMGVKIQYIQEVEPLGTAGALYLLRDILAEDFLLINGDIIFDISVRRFYNFHCSHNALITALVHPSDHIYDSEVVQFDCGGRIVAWYQKERNPGWYPNCVNAGIHIVSPMVLKEFGLFEYLRRADWARDIIQPLISSGRIFAYTSSEYVKDMGTPARYSAVIADIQSGVVSKKSFSHKHKAVFLDRDGTINQYVGFLTDINAFYLCQGASEAIRRINCSEYLAIVVTNQPVLARGEVTEQQLRQVHNKMETLLSHDGAHIDAIYVCPHHPCSGYKGEVTSLKKECECRKPKPGMLLSAAAHFNLELCDSWMIGDSPNDILAGQAAGCQTVLLGDKNIGATFCSNSLLSAVKEILKE